MTGPEQITIAVPSVLPEAQRLLAEVATVVGPDDPVLARLRLRATVRGVGR